jgi:hypothetical protein
MKFPFDFSIALVFRLVFPGVVLATVLLPFFLGLFAWIGFKEITATILLPILAVVFGWFIVLSDQPIYMFLEGRRYSPSWLREWMRRGQVRRLEKIKARHARLTEAGKTPEANEVNVGKLDYPINDKGEFHASMPTRLGNLIYAYETYTNTAYGLDSIFYWYRLWLVLDKDLRQALDETQAIADSPVYVCFASYLSAVVVLLYALGGFVAETLHRTLFNLPYLPSPPLTLALSALPLCLGYLLYRVSLFAQRGYGELYKSLFDQFRHKLAFVKGVNQLAVCLGADAAEAADIKARFTVTSRYLRWHKIRPPNGKNIAPEQWALQRPPPPPK